MSKYFLKSKITKQTIYFALLNFHSSFVSFALITILTIILINKDQEFDSRN